MLIKTVLVKPDCEPEIVEIEDTLENLQNAVEGYIEYLWLSREQKYIILVNEEGAIRHLQPNMMLVGEGGRKVPIFGNILFTGKDSRTGDITSLSDREAKSICNMMKVFQAQ